MFDLHGHDQCFGAGGGGGEGGCCVKF